ncbi:MAG TPA: hypothetical protein VKX39_01305 [Bryobacteraceae bacterium]|jgi:cytosine/adenosine deaminase-related metal-dependent hydrolase|nr:hypothetical protein [Bryobacteraceae bacterium]
MLIRNARIAVSPTQTVNSDLVINGAKSPALDLEGHLLLPGLVNAHDHLEFNLFPRLGRRIYSNASEWAADIHRPRESPVREHLELPKPLRLFWGALRNLLSGVTTVAHHNPYNKCFKQNFPVRVVRRCGWAHSLAFSPDLAHRHRATPPDWPFVLHAGEGTDRAAQAELGQLRQLGVLTRRTVLVHAIAFDPGQIPDCAIVWCPSSNLLTYGRTLQPRPGSRIVLGTDSAISAAGDMIDEIRIAHRHCGASLESLYAMLTTQPARIFHLNAASDFIAVADRRQTPAQALLDLSPELVIVAGRIHLISRRLASQIGPDQFHPIALEHRGQWLTPFDIPRLLQRTRAILGPEIRLAGKRVWA